MFKTNIMNKNNEIYINERLLILVICIALLTKSISL